LWRAEPFLALRVGGLQGTTGDGGTSRRRSVIAVMSFADIILSVENQRRVGSKLEARQETP